MSMMIGSVVPSNIPHSSAHSAALTMTAGPEHSFAKLFQAFRNLIHFVKWGHLQIEMVMVMIMMMVVMMEVMMMMMMMEVMMMDQMITQQLVESLKTLE